MISIPITSRDENFEIELFDPEGGAKIGKVNRTAVTITSEDGKYGCCLDVTNELFQRIFSLNKYFIIGCNCDTIVVSLPEISNDVEFANQVSSTAILETDTKSTDFTDISNEAKELLKDFTQTLNDHKIPDYEKIVKMVEETIEEQRNQGYSRYY